MKSIYLLILFSFGIGSINGRKLLTFNNEDELRTFLEGPFEKNASQECYLLNNAGYNFNTDINNKQKEKAVLDQTLLSAAVIKNLWENYFRDLKENDFKDELVRRQVRVLTILGSSALDEDKLTKLTNIKTSMTNAYSTGKICPYKNQNCDLVKEGLDLEPEISDIMEKSDDYDELLYVWLAWRNATGVKIKEDYKDYVTLSNEAAKANGFTDNGEMWRFDYETDNFEEYLDNIWKELEPLYVALHTYVKGKLKEKFGDKLDVSDGNIPAHVLGNMWAQDWQSLNDLVKPYPDASDTDISEELAKQNYTILKMFETSDEFYQSMGLLPNTISYDTRYGAVIEKPKDRDITCHASAWDFCDGKTFRIKMCTKIDFKDFITIHHEMGHIQYYLQYKDQPFALRSGANPGFHEAIGDAIALSVSTPKHLKTIGLLKNYVESEEADINALMAMALERVVFLPYGLLMDKWRWKVFSGESTPATWNSDYWKYREIIQRVKAPVPRSDDTDFDPGAKYHVPADSQYINYFFAHVLEFQFYRGLCMEAGEYDPNDLTKPLHKCDFYKSKVAGSKFSAGLKLGASKHWKDVLEVITGERELQASAVLEYFAPLKKYLDKINGNL